MDGYKAEYDMQKEAEKLYRAAQKMTVQDLGRGYKMELNRRVFGPDGRVVVDFKKPRSREPEYAMAGRD